MSGGNPLNLRPPLSPTADKLPFRRRSASGVISAVAGTLQRSCQLIFARCIRGVSRSKSSEAVAADSRGVRSDHFARTNCYPLSLDWSRLPGHLEVVSSTIKLLYNAHPAGCAGPRGPDVALGEARPGDAGGRVISPKAVSGPPSGRSPRWRLIRPISARSTVVARPVTQTTHYHSAQ
jgi:hypothetical protein